MTIEFIINGEPTIIPVSSDECLYDAVVRALLSVGLQQFENRDVRQVDGWILELPMSIRELHIKDHERIFIGPARRHSE